MVDSGDAIWIGICCGGLFAGGLGGGCACSHSCRREIALERISIGELVCFSKVNWFLLNHKDQQIQAKMFEAVLISGRFTLVIESSKEVLNEEQIPN
ncbi:unnamed protein product [Brassica napus]|uniref:(rape) hypothetical protein n=1 Tax=Brassica napus TaxID=3708 RepID=A0A816YKF0_BRANA|nr:unnamed protein product [Brassica napus]